MQKHHLVRLTLAVALSAALSACAGGGTKPDTIPTPPPPTETPPPTSPPAPPPATPEHTYPESNHLVPTGALDAQAKGFDGTGVKVGVLDSGIDPTLAAFDGRIASFKSYIHGGSDTPNDVEGHGSVITEVMAGSKTSTFAGGVAPGAELHIAQACDADGACYTPQAAYDDLTAQGVKLFNQSFGFTADGPNDYVADQLAAIHQPLVDAGDLFVWAAGNSGADKPNFEAILPSYRPNLQKGWLTAVNVTVDGEGKVGGLDATSAACGVAAQWCLAAPGTSVTDPLPGTKFDTGLADGTSASAAIITGVAAQVWQAFPWMTGGNVQQTLLTTATHMGDGTGPNDTFGWGLVNADKAVDGPAQFAFGAFVANLGDYNSTFSNNISGTGSLTLYGKDGSLTLTGDNTYAGGTTISSGALLLTGSLASDVSIDAAGSLSGDGSVHASVLNGGTLASVGATDGQGMTIGGDYTAYADSTTAIAIGNPLTVDGSAVLKGTLQILAPSDTYVVKATETLLTADLIAGTFAKQTYGPSVYYKATVNYGASEVTADLQRMAVTQSMALPTAAMASTAKGLDSALTQADKWSQTDYAGHADFLNSAASFLSAQTDAQAQASVQSLGGEIYSTTGVVEAQQSRLVDDALALRQNQLDGNADPAVWVQALAANGSLKQGDFSAARYDTSGVLVGGEAQITENFDAGVAVGRSQMNTNLSGSAGRVKGRDDTVALYGRVDMGHGAYLAGRASWSHQRVDVNRSALIGSNVEALSSSRTDGIGRFALELGKSTQIGSNVLTPYLSVSALRLDQDAFTEAGAGGFGLVAQSHRHTATQGDVGLRFGRQFDWAGGYSVLSGYAAYRRILAGVNLDFTAALVGAPEATFTAMGQEMARNTGQIGLNLSTRINQDWDWFINADAQSARGGSHSFGGNAGIRFHF